MFMRVQTVSMVCRIGDKLVFLCRKSQSTVDFFQDRACSRRQRSDFFRHQARRISIISRYKMTKYSSFSSSGGKIEKPTASPIGILLWISISISKGSKKMVQIYTGNRLYITWRATAAVGKSIFSRQGGQLFWRFLWNFCLFARWRSTIVITYHIQIVRKRSTYAITESLRPQSTALPVKRQQRKHMEY